MESNSSPLRVHLSAAAAALLRAQAPELAEHLEPRGKISVKGKGLMETFWLRTSPLSERERARLLSEISRREAAAAAKERAPLLRSEQLAESESGPRRRPQASRMTRLLSQQDAPRPMAPPAHIRPTARTLPDGFTIGQSGSELLKQLVNVMRRPSFTPVAG